MICSFTDYISQAQGIMLPALHACHTVFRFIARCPKELLEENKRAMTQFDHFAAHLTHLLSTLRLTQLRNDIPLDSVVVSVVHLGPACHTLIEAHPNLTKTLYHFSAALLALHIEPPITIYDRRLRYSSWGPELLEAQIALSRLCKLYETPEPDTFLLLAHKPTTSSGLVIDIPKNSKEVVASPVSLDTATLMGPDSGDAEKDIRVTAQLNSKRRYESR